MPLVSLMSPDSWLRLRARVLLRAYHVGTSASHLERWSRKQEPIISKLCIGELANVPY